MARKKRKQSSDEFNVPGLSVKRVGKLIEWISFRTPEEDARMKRGLWDARPKIMTDH